MKIDQSKLKKCSSEVPADCKGLIDRLTSNKAEFLSELQRIEQLWISPVFLARKWKKFYLFFFDLRTEVLLCFVNYLLCTIIMNNSSKLGCMYFNRLFYCAFTDDLKIKSEKTKKKLFKMKIDRSKLKKSSSEVPADCKGLIDRLTSTSNKAEFLSELQRIETWTYGKCELLHWIDVLDLCDEVLEAAAARPEGKWALAVDGGDDKLKELVLWTLHFTTLLIEHSFSRHLYSSMEHLTTLLASSDLDVVLAVLNLLYMFSKRSNFIARLAAEKRSGLLSRLTHLAAGWGGKDNGFGLSKCCSDDAVRYLLFFIFQKLLYVVTRNIHPGLKPVSGRGTSILGWHKPETRVNIACVCSIERGFFKKKLKWNFPVKSYRVYDCIWKLIFIFHKL